MDDGCRCERCREQAEQVAAIMREHSVPYELARSALKQRQIEAAKRKRSLTPLTGIAVQQLREIEQAGKAPRGGTNGGEYGE